MVRHWAPTWQTWHILLFLFQKMFLCMLLLLVLFIIACPPVLGWPSMLLFREGLRFHCRHYSLITFLTDWFSKSQFSLSTLNATAQTRAVVSLSSSLPFVGGMMILSEIYLPFTLHASLSHGGVACSGFLSLHLHHSLINNLCKDRCIAILLHFMLLNFPQSWPNLSNTDVCFNNLV